MGLRGDQERRQVVVVAMKIHSSIYSPSHVIALHKKGLTNKAIAIRTGLSMERIRRIVNKHKQEQQQEKGDNVG